MFTEPLPGPSAFLGISAHIFLFSWSHIPRGEAKPTSKYTGKMISYRGARNREGSSGVGCELFAALTVSSGQVLGAGGLGPGPESEPHRQRDRNENAPGVLDGQAVLVAGHGASEEGGCLQIEGSARNLGSILTGKALEGLKQEQAHHRLGFLRTPVLPTENRLWEQEWSREPGSPVHLAQMGGCGELHQDRREVPFFP